MSEAYKGGRRPPFVCHLKNASVNLLTLASKFDTLEYPLSAPFDLSY